MGVLLTSSQPSQTRVGQRSSGFSIRHRLAEISEVPTSLRRRSLLVDPNLRNGVVHDTPRRVGGEAKREIVIVDEGYPFVKPQGSRELGPYQHRLNGQRWPPWSEHDAARRNLRAAVVELAVPGAVPQLMEMLERVSIVGRGDQEVACLQLR